ncbi:MAG: type II secretion system F family protein [Candidatus Latescibacteria bacterium]|jgi:type IV pilus assembly protein PilC|nr:pilus assembly protein PilC [Acidobacteriota bacterium]MDP7448829.1 type II secretion system F family protein [Candidatus Latescibacterota bacterium]HJN43110.1 type II secretion system F family protein [Vicinamibacterales bacterium]|tara:strand:+ start:3660 stop:4874 length:1215 start_codon:yes stop_codon:yes gene_type:complete
MPTFAYSGRTRAGESVSGQRIADTIDAAVSALRREQVLVTKIDAVAGGSRATKKLRRGKAVPSKNLAIFTRQFSVMIDAGLPLVQCLDILGKQEEDKNFSTIILKTRSDVEGGSGLAEAMRKHPQAFDALYTNMMAAGEAGGILDTILKRLATYIEKNVKLKAQVKSAMTYPIAVMSIAAIVVAAILWKVIPTFADLFAGLGATLPLPTRVVIALSNSLVTFMPFVIVGGVALVFAFRQFYATHNGRRVVDGVLLKVPVLGVIIRKVAVARFCRTLATLLGSGVPILEGLEITARTAGNAIIEDAVMVTRGAIERGETVSGPLRDTGVFPPMVTQMINVGEATGALDTMLSKIADFYEDEVDTAVAGMLTLLEPIMIAFLGVVVGGIVIAMYLPIFDLISRMAG